MLYGNIIFIKKTGGDGSKYPVSEKSIKIGRSEECLIRIYNNQVALEHCELIIGENGQATLKDLCNQTCLNGNILKCEEATLCHGDIFKVGERLARWEYLPTSQYHRQLISPTGRLVAIVMPQQRCLEDESSQPLASVGSGLKNTPVGGKRKYSEQFASGSTSAAKIRKSCSSSLSNNSKRDFSKQLIGRHSLKTKKSLLVAKIKERKSISGKINSKTPKRKSTKSVLPLWKENIVSSPTTKLVEETSLSRKSARSENTVKNSQENIFDSEPEKLLSEKKKIRISQRTVGMSKENANKTSEALKKPVNVPKNSPLKAKRLTETSFSKSPSPKKAQLTSKPGRLIHSEKKLKYNVEKSPSFNKKLKRLSLGVSKADKNKEDIELSKSLSREELKHLRARMNVSETIVQPKLKYCRSNKRFSVKTEKRSIKMTTPEKFEETSRKSSRKNKVPNGLEDESNDTIKSKKGEVLNFRKQSIAAKSTPLKKTPTKLEKSVGDSKLSSAQKNFSKSPSRSRTSTASSTSINSKSSSVQIPVQKASKRRVSTPRGVRRKLSPSISSAERAAKKLKISNPRKPDKNKKAALLVLGKANRKQLIASNVKVLLKQKLLKKAIKQSTISTDKNDTDKKKIIAGKSKPKKGLRKNISKDEMKTKTVNNFISENISGNSSKSSKALVKNKIEKEITSRTESALEGKVLRDPQVTEKSHSSPSKFKNLFNETPEKFMPNQYKKSESPGSILSTSQAKETNLPSSKLAKTAENFLFNSNRRCSKRLRSKNDLGRPDFVELSPTALGLIPKNIEVFKSPRQNKRKSSSLVTPRNVQSIGIIKSASTSKIEHRKNVRFSSKDTSLDSEFGGLSEKTDFDFEAFQSPDVSVDVFISPLGNKTDNSKKDLNESFGFIFGSGDNSDRALPYKSNSEPRKCVRKLLQSPQPSGRTSSNQNKLLQSARSSAAKVRQQLRGTGIADSESNLKNINSEICATPKNNLSDINGVLRLLGSSKSDTNDIKKVKKLQTISKSPKNDLSDLRGVKKLLATPKVQKSPKNDLSDVKGVKKLLTTPKVQKSPKNDLSDVRGVKKLLATPKVQKSPKNDLSDVKGVKKLLTTPKVQKSPKNDLSDVRGVKKLLATPKVQKSPKNDLSDVRGVKKLLATPKVQKSPKNDLSDLRGVKKLLETPKIQKSPRNDLNDVVGVKELFINRMIQESPAKALLELSGLQQLFESPKPRRGSKRNATEVMNENVELFDKNIIDSPRNQKFTKMSSKDLKKISESIQLDKSAPGDILNVERDEQILFGKSKKSDPSSQSSIRISYRKSHANDFRAIRGRRSISFIPKEPKNDLSDLTGVSELFARYEVESDFSRPHESEKKTPSTSKRKTSGKKSTTGTVQELPKTVNSENTGYKDEYIKTRRGRRGLLRKAEETTESLGDKNSKTENKTKPETRGRKLVKRKVANTARPSEASKSPAIVKRSKRIKKETEKSGETSEVKLNAEPEIKTRKRKATENDAAMLPSKWPKKPTAESMKMTRTRSKTAQKNSVETSGKISAKAKTEPSKSSKVQNKSSKTSTKRVLTVQKKKSSSSSKKTLSDSDKKLSPLKTRSSKRKTESQQNRVTKLRTTAENKTTESKAGRKKLTSAVKKSTRRKKT